MNVTSSTSIYITNSVLDPLLQLQLMTKACKVGDYSIHVYSRAYSLSEEVLICLENYTFYQWYLMTLKSSQHVNQLKQPLQLQNWICVCKINLVRIGCYFYSHNLAAIKMVTQSNKAEAIRFYDYCLTNANLIFLVSQTFCSQFSQLNIAN